MSNFNLVVVNEPSTTLSVEEELAGIVIEIGIPGTMGPPGIQGPIGPAGGPANPTFTFTQSSPLAGWIINHNLGFNPILTVTDIGGNEVEAEIVHISSNLTMVYFSQPQTGKARCV